jgi:hypothetical protein
MRQEVKLTDAIGKTLEGIAFSWTCGQAVLTFTDGTFSTLRATRGDDPEIEEDDLSFEDFGDTELIRAGVATADELEALRQARKAESEARWKRDSEARDRAEFERLKRKFGA